MTDPESHGPSSFIDPSTDTYNIGGPSNSDYYDPDYDYFNFDLLNADLNAPLDPHYDFGNDVSESSKRAHEPEEDPTAFLLGSALSKRRRVTRSLVTSPNEGEQPAFSADDPQPVTPRLAQAMTDEVGPQRSLECPFRVAQAKLRLPYTCRGIQAKTVADVRRHCIRNLPGRKPPHLPFLKLCPTCNEDFLHEAEYDRDHGVDGLRCETPRKQRKGDAGQQEQWENLYAKVDTCIHSQLTDHSSTADALDDAHHASAVLAETPIEGDIQRPTTELTPSKSIDTHVTGPPTSRTTEERRERRVDLPALGQWEEQYAPSRDVRMQMTNLVHRSEELVHSGKWVHRSDDLQICGSGDYVPPWCPGTVMQREHDGHVIMIDDYSRGESQQWPSNCTLRPPHNVGFRKLAAATSYKHDDEVQSYSQHEDRSWTSWASASTGDTPGLTEATSSNSPMEDTIYTQQWSPLQQQSSAYHRMVPTNTPFDLFQLNLERSATPHVGGIPRSVATSSSSITEYSGHPSWSSVLTSEPDAPPHDDSEVLECAQPGCQTFFTGDYRRGNLGRHRRLRHGNKFYVCEDDTCAKEFKRQDARLKHYRKYHPDLAASTPYVARSAGSRRPRGDPDVDLRDVSSWT